MKTRNTGIKTPYVVIDKTGKKRPPLDTPKAARIVLREGKMTRYIVEVYKVEIPEADAKRSDLVKFTETMLEKLGRDRCLECKMQGPFLGPLADEIGMLACLEELDH